MVDLVIPDTNAWLDVVRARAVSQGQAPAPSSSAEDASRISRLVAAGELRVGLHPLVALEYERNLDNVVTTARQSYRETVKRLSRLGVPELPPDVLKPEHLLANDQLIATQLMAQAEDLKETDEDRRRADDRYGQRRPPAHTGSSTHDARILEAALRVAQTRELETTWLITRNTAEFEQDGELHPQLKAEYDAAGLGHARSWRHYLAQRGLLGT